MNQMTHLKNTGIFHLSPKRMEYLKNMATLITLTLNVLLLGTFERTIKNPIVILF